MSWNDKDKPAQCKVKGVSKVNDWKQIHTSTLLKDP